MLKWLRNLFTRSKTEVGAVTFADPHPSGYLDCDKCVSLVRRIDACLVGSALRPLHKANLYRHLYGAAHAN